MLIKTQISFVNTLLFTGMESGGFYKDTPDFSQSNKFLQTLSNSRYDFLRSNERFIAIEYKLKNL